MKWTKMEAIESRKQETLVKRKGEVQHDLSYPLRDMTYVYKNETSCSYGTHSGRIERWYFKGDRQQASHSMYRLWIYKDGGEVSFFDSFYKLTYCKDWVEHELREGDLLRFSHFNEGFSPHGTVYRVQLDKYPHLTYDDVLNWVLAKEKALMGYRGQYMEVYGGDDPTVELFHHVLKRKAKVKHRDLVDEVNEWGSNFIKA